MLDVTMNVLSFPFWFLAFVFTFAGVFGSIKLNGVPYYGKYWLIIKIGATSVGLVFGLVAYAMIVMF